MNILKHEELYRSTSVIEKIAKQKITICGAGAIGSNLTDNLARQGFRDLTIIDMDRIEEHNIHTQIWNTRDIGTYKTAALKKCVFNAMSFMIKDVSKKLEESNVKKFLTQSIVIDGFDNVESRKLVTNFCKTNKFECLHIGLFKDYAEVIWNDIYRVPDDTSSFDVCEYPLARNIILLAVAIGTEILIKYISENKKDSCVITLKDLKIEKI